MQVNKSLTKSVAHPVLSKNGRRFVLLTLFGGASFYGIGAFGMMAYDILAKLFA